MAKNRIIGDWVQESGENADSTAILLGSEFWLLTPKE
jgi:hypothetical protein